MRLNQILSIIFVAKIVFFGLVENVCVNPHFKISKESLHRTAKFVAQINNCSKLLTFDGCCVDQSKNDCNRFHILSFTAKVFRLNKYGLSSYALATYLIFSYRLSYNFDGFGECFILDLPFFLFFFCVVLS